MRRALRIALALALATGMSASAAPSAERGEAIYARCAACHSLAQDRVGPHHCGLIGRRSGSVAGFAYSQAMKDARIVWNARSLDRFLAAPMKTVPGTSMTYDGVTDAAERADVIAYLERANASPECTRAR